MITQVRSWTHDDSIPTMIGRKKVDWSIFEYGTTIPNDFRSFFSIANGGEEIEVGKGKQVTLICDGNLYQASLRNVDQRSAGRETLQLRYHSSEIKELMVSRFKQSYNYISALRPQDSGNKKQVVVPDRLAEYIELYSTDIPYTYEMKLIPLNNSHRQMPNIWWVNQGATLAEEKEEGIIWAPLTGKGGRSQYHWDTMDEVKQCDIILHYANGSLRFVSKAIEDCVHAQKPSSMSSSNWNEQGRLVRVEYHEILPQILLTQFSQDIMKLQIDQGPIHSGAGVKQGYLFRFSLEGLQTIQESAPEVEWPEFTLFNATQTKEKEVMTSLPILEDDDIANTLKQIQSYISNRGFHYPQGLIENLYLSLKSKPFVILAGVSGTGKTKLVKLFAEALGATGDNHQFTLIPVRPDWSDPSDLLGYKDLSGAFRPGRLAEVLVEASQPANQHKPYFICLDEMNLARVEYYFSDVLSVIETQEWKQDRIVTSKLINRESLLPEDQSVYGDLSIPDNVYLIGTVNMDETTHPFSKKVLDRANTIEFNYIDLQQYPSLALQEEETLLPVHNSFLRSEYLQLVDVYADYTDLVHTTTEKLVKINHILEEIHSHVGFRIRDSICFYMVYNQRYELLTPDEAFDLQLLQKILPRVQGSSLSVKRVLLKLLEEALGRKLSSFSDLMEDASNIDQEWNDDQEEKKAKHPLSARKIAFMLRRLEEDGFTSYWLS